MNWWCKCFSLHSPKDHNCPELARPQGGSEYAAQPTQTIKHEQLARVLKRALGLSRLQPMYSFLATEDVQHQDDEHIIETSNGNHNGIVINCIWQSLYILLSITYIYILCNILSLFRNPV